MKLNVLLRELPDFIARPGQDQPHHYGQINAPLTHAEWKTGFAASSKENYPSTCGARFTSRVSMTPAWLQLAGTP